MLAGTSGTGTGAGFLGAGGVFSSWGAATWVGNTGVFSAHALPSVGWMATEARAGGSSTGKRGGSWGDSAGSSNRRALCAGKPYRRRRGTWAVSEAKVYRCKPRRFDGRHDRLAGVDAGHVMRDHDGAGTNGSPDRRGAYSVLAGEDADGATSVGGVHCARQGGDWWSPPVNPLLQGAKWNRVLVFEGRLAQVAVQAHGLDQRADPRVLHIDGGQGRSKVALADDALIGGVGPGEKKMASLVAGRLAQVFSRIGCTREMKKARVSLLMSRDGSGSSASACGLNLYRLRPRRVQGSLEDGHQLLGLEVIGPKFQCTLSLGQHVLGKGSSH